MLSIVTDPRIVDRVQQDYAFAPYKKRQYSTNEVTRRADIFLCSDL